MKICAIGDPHGELEKIKKIPLDNVDLILITGDVGKATLSRKMAFENIKRKKQGLKPIKYSLEQEKKAYMEFYNSSLKIIKYLAKHAPVFLIYGNAEPSNKETRKLSGKIKDLPSLTGELKKIKGVRIINNRIARFKGVRIGGLRYFVDVCWVREFKPHDYKKELKKARKETDKAKKILKWFGNVDILLSHQPPYGILDKVTAKFAPKEWIGKHAGSKVILNYIKSKQPKYVFCGHIHEGEGTKKISKTMVYNLSVGGYKIVEF